MADVDHWTRWARDLGGIVEIAGVNGWAVAGDAGAVLRGSEQPAQTRAVILVGSEEHQQAATEALRRTSQYRPDADTAPLDPTWQGWSRQVLSHGPEPAPPAAQPPSTQVAVVAVPEEVAQPILEEARAQAVDGVPVPSPPQLVALGVLMPDGSVGSLTGPQTAELAAMTNGWRSPSEWFRWMAGHLPEINRVSLGQAVWERFDVEQDQYYNGGERAFVELQRRAGFREVGFPLDGRAPPLAEAIDDVEARLPKTPPAQKVGLMNQLDALRGLERMWTGMTDAPSQWWRAYASYSHEMGGRGLSRGTFISPVGGAGSRRTFLHTPPTTPGHGIGRR